eukprot:scaffold408_cov57-Phaeocystis_antarctica.AAC.2
MQSPPKQQPDGTVRANLVLKAINRLEACNKARRAGALVNTGGSRLVPENDCDRDGRSSLLRAIQLLTRIRQMPPQT